MRSSARILAIALAMILTASSFVLAAVSVVSPTANDIIYSDSFLLSVKLTDTENIRVSVYEKKDSRTVEVTSGGKTEKKTQYFSVDVSEFKSEDIALISAGKTVDENGAPILLSTGEAVKIYSDFLVAEPERFSNNSSAAVYTKTFSEMSPGLYRVRVERFAPDGSVKSTSSLLFALKEKEAEEKKDVLGPSQGGAVQAIQNLLRSLFR